MVYYLFGADSFRSHEKLEGITEKFLESHRSGTGLSVVDCGESSKDFDVVTVFGSADLFSPQKLVVVKRCCESSSLEFQERVAEYLNQHSQLKTVTDTVIVFWEGIMPDNKSKLAAYLEKNFSSQKFDLLDGKKLNDWVVETVKKLNSQVTIDAKARTMLVGMVGADLYRLHNELEKLTTFRQTGTIEEKDVEQLVTVQGEADVFATIEAGSSGNTARALELLLQSLRAGADPYYLFSMYIYQFRNLLKISEHYGHGMGNKFEIAKKTKLHPYVVEKGIHAVKRLSLEQLKKIYRLLGTLDEQIKIGKTDINAALEKIIFATAQETKK